MDQHHRFELTEPVHATDHAIGPAHAAVTVVEYGDFECPNCKQAAPAVKLLLKHFANRVRFVYRHFPLEEVHPHALSAAEAAECAGAQGKFWEMHDRLFDHQSHLGLHQLQTYAADLELEMTRFNAEMSSHIYRQRIREQIQSGDASGARGTPTFFVNGRIQDVSFGLTSLFDAVDKVLAR
jgi:protein-disulfide isomerase